MRPHPAASFITRRYPPGGGGTPYLYFQEVPPPRVFVTFLSATLLSDPSPWYIQKFLHFLSRSCCNSWKGRHSLNKSEKNNHDKSSLVELRSAAAIMFCCKSLFVAFFSTCILSAYGKSSVCFSSWCHALTWWSNITRHPLRCISFLINYFSLIWVRKQC